jgi:beta-lactamase superfamily II metal-dependent hydrolase
MTCEIAFLPVGNADCIIVCSVESTVIIDIGNPRLLDQWLQKKQRNNINPIYITHAHRDHFPQLVKVVQFLAIWIERGQVERFILPHSVYKDACENFIEKHLAQTRSRLNEISLVLRISYDQFAALLLADIEGEGLKECLDICTEDELKANIVKIPHHGAYPKNSEDLKQLLEKIDAEIAILSVSSTNPYGHVMPVG